MQNPPVVLSIAGFDPSSGAGVTADIKTAAALDCYAVTCISALTVQSTQGVFAVEPVSPDVVRETLYYLAEDVEVAGTRVGMLGSKGVAETVTKFLRRYRFPNMVLDPVLRSSSGMRLLDDDGISYIRKWLLPRVDVVTPNWEEAAVLSGMECPSIPDSWEDALPLAKELAGRLHEMGCRGIVITGGHLTEANDFLSVKDGTEVKETIFPGSRIETKATHGTGCAFATALTCLLARGKTLPEAVGEAKEFVRQAMLAAYPVGKGRGPMNHLYRLGGTAQE